MFEAAGFNGTARFDGRMLTITRNRVGRMTLGKGEKHIPLVSITAVQWKPAGGMISGFIQFGVAGSVEGRSEFGRQTKDAKQDENAVVFNRKQQPVFEQLRDMVNEAITARSEGTQRPAAVSVADELQKLAGLLRSGVLTVPEFEQQKARLLA